MGYFRELPDVEYQSFLSDSKSGRNFIKVKNLFRRNKLRDDLQNVFTLFNKYQIVDGARPDTIAQEYYGSSDLDWIVLMTAGITRVRDQWPLSNRDLNNYIIEKYGVENTSNTHHYETVEIKDSQGRVILPAGKIVDEDFKITYFDDGKYYTNDNNLLLPNVILIDDPIISISNIIYETRKNDEKSSIYLLKPSYLQEFLNDMRDIMVYGRSSQYLNDSLIRTENTRNTSP